MNLSRFLLAPAAACAALFLSFAAMPARATIDLNADQIPDIWALRYSSGALAPDADSDGDGQKNIAEAAAGTDPAQPSSVIKITSIVSDLSGVHLTFPTEQGKRYQVQTATALTSATWTDLGTPLSPDGSGSLNATNNAGNATGLFYRVRVQDIDSDGDGVTDWEELQVGFDPYNSHSGGLSGASDLAAITQGLQSPNTITVRSTVQHVTEPAAGNGSTGTGTFVVTRSGGFGSVTVYYSIGGTAVAGSDYVALDSSVTLPVGVNTASITVTPLPDALVESPESVLLTLSPSVDYTVGAPGVAAVLVDDYVQANGTGLTGQFYNEGTVNGNTLSASNGPTFSNRVLTRTDATANFDYLVTAWPGAPVNATQFASRWTGEVLPEFSQIYTFYTDVNAAGRLWVNGQLLTNNWPRAGFTTASGETSGTIELQAGSRYSIQFEHYEVSGNNAKAKLSWASANQPKQVIPQTRLFPNTAPKIAEPLDLLLLKGSGAFTYQINASGAPTSYTAAGLPAGWTLNTNTGLMTIPTAAAGTWEIPLTATNANGSGSAILEVTVIATDGLITRDVWTGLPGNQVSLIPLTTAPNSTGTLTSLETPQNAGDDFGDRIRGYITPPGTGAYKFWLAADEAAELWISDDDEPVNAFKRAQLTAPVGYRDWAAGAATQLLYLEIGKRYYVEVRRKEGSGSDHVSVGWLKPGEAGPLASEVVPGYALSQYVAPTVVPGESALYTTSLTAQSSAVSSGYGSGTLQLSADETVATLRFTYANLTTNLLASGRHIHAANHGGNIIFDIDTATPNPDGSYTWVIAAVGAISVQNILDEIHGGTAYLNIHTATYPAGEIKGFFTLQAASQTFTIPPAPPAWSDNHTDRNAASRFLIQSTFGPTQNDLNSGNANAVLNLGYNGWIDYQASLPVTRLYPQVFASRNQTDPSNNTFSQSQLFSAWWRTAVTAPDQLRQRVAFALSEILVTSEDGVLDEKADAMSSYYDTLLDNSFGNFKGMLKAVTLHPAMGRYLDMLRNDKPDKTTGRIPNENYAREIQQLFSIGLNRLHPDGSLILNSKGQLIPTYDQNAIIGFAHVFSGWDYGYTGGYRTSFGAGANWIDPMREVPVRHFIGQKRLLNNVVLPGLTTVAGQPIDPYATHTATQYNDPVYQALPGQDLDAAHDALFNHPNCGPFICRQLIQRLVTSTPSRGYLYRVARTFDNNGSGVRGDMLAVVKAILLDYEARSSAVLAQQGFGKQREPVVRVAAIGRGFAVPAPITGTYAQQGSLIEIETSAPHLYLNGNTVPLDFQSSTSGDAGAPVSGNYALKLVDATHFTVRTRSYEAATYQQGGAITRFTTTGDGFFPGVGETVQIEYLTGTPLPPDSGTDAIDYRSVDTLEIILGAPTAKVGNYAQTASTITVTSTAHGFLAGSNVQIDFITGSSGIPASGIYPIATVTANAFTITAADAIARTGVAFAIPEANVLSVNSGNANITRLGEFANRAGAVSVSYGDFGMDTTNTELNQTPLQAPTVFNFFLPDYQFPGILANAGLITPEFQLTSETSVVRQANFIYNGIYNDALLQPGLASFKSGGRDVMVDLRSWMGTGPGGLPWAHTNNLPALIDELSTQLMAGQLSAAAKTQIRDHAASLAYNGVISSISVASPCVITVNAHGLVDGQTVTISGVTGGTFSQAINGTFIVDATGANTFTVGVNRTSSTPAVGLTGAIATPIPTLLRDRVRAVVHLIVTSPDFTIQK